MLGIIFPTLLVAQNDSNRVLPILLVKSIRFHQFQTGVFVQNLDSLALQFKASQNLDQILAQSSGVFIKSYGPSQLSSSSSRGGNAQQTAVLWNGFNLSNPMLGQQDLSSLPGFLLDAVSIQYGSQAGLYGSGNMGGSIQLGTQSNLPLGFHLTALGGIGSSGENNQGLKFSWANSKFSVRQKIYHQSATNNFSFINPIGIKENAQEAATSTLSWMQDFRILIHENHEINLHTWLQKNNRQIPPVFGTPTSHARQNDESIRISGDYKFRKGAYLINNRFAFFEDKIDYYDDGNGLDISTGKQTSIAIDQNYFGKNYQLLLSTQLQYLAGKSDQYQSQQGRFQPAIFASLIKQFWKHKIDIQLTGRQEWNNGKIIPFIPAFGMNIKMSPSIQISANLSKAYRLPTLNDLYWVPGGNINLKPETGINSEIGLKIKAFRFIGTEIHINLYQRTTENQITWIPLSDNKLTVLNITKVETSGLEFHWKNQFKIKAFRIGMKGQHDYCSALNKTNTSDPAYNKQMIYVPRIKHSLQVFLEWKSFQLNYIHQYIGQRFYSSDNTTSLDQYQIGNISLRKNFRFKQHHFGVQLSRTNMWNSNYVVVLNRPMPLAQNQISLQYQF